MIIVQRIELLLVLWHMPIQINFQMNVTCFMQVIHDLYKMMQKLFKTLKMIRFFKILNTVKLLCNKSVNRNRIIGKPKGGKVDIMLSCKPNH
jgi:hypothetical protein